MRLLHLPAFLSPKAPPYKNLPGGANLGVVVHYTALLGFAGHLMFVPLFLWLGVRPMAVVNAISCGVFGLCFWLNRRGHTHVALVCGMAEVTLHAILAVLFTGWDTGFHYYILGLLPLIFYSTTWRTRWKFALSFLLGIAYITLFLHMLNTPPFSTITLNQIRITATINIFTVFWVFIALAHSYRLAATLAENALQQVNRRLEIQAWTDPLTHLANRRIMQDALNIARDSYRVNGAPFAVILGDIDHFKKFNDQFGHENGDRVLVHVAETMRREVREQDVVARWGGEEFLVLVAGSTAKEAGQIAERLRAEVAGMKVEIGGKSQTITITLGVAEYSGEPNLDDCLKRADDAMYEGKRLGRNCVVLVDGDD